VNKLIKTPRQRQPKRFEERVPKVYIKLRKWSLSNTRVYMPHNSKDISENSEDLALVVEN
jgi:hypothetical protein